VSLVLFTAIVVQWITSKDNAGTSGGSMGETHSSRRGGGNGTNFEPDGNNVAAQYSPHMTPSTKAVMEDVAEISLDSTDRPVRVVSASSDKASDSSGQTKVPTPNGVLVTTTIKRESKPGGIIFQEMTIEDGHAHRGPSRPLSGALGLSSDSFMRANGTKITAGAHH
jgi:hypothetical protein